MESIVTQASQLIAEADEAGRQKILVGLQNLSHSLETPRETIARKMYSAIQVAAARIASDLQLYNLLEDSKESLTVSQIAKATGAAPLLVGRLLRYLASQGDIEEVGPDAFTSNNVTKIMSDPGAQGGIYLYWDSLGLAMQALPDFLKEHKYADVEDSDDTPHQKGHNTRLRGFEWAATRPDILEHAQKFMKIHHLGLPTWLDVYPWKKLAESLAPEQVFFVDVGGSTGHQSVALREQVPDLPNKIILQDTPETLKFRLPHVGVEAVPHDFYKPQVIQGAKIYYLRHVLHDYCDDDAVRILGHLKDALAPGSVILIDEMVVPDQGAHWQVTSLDFIMMLGASLERTRGHWYEVVAKAGLKVNEVVPYVTVLPNSVIECVVA